jgi:hypothetical protein
MFDNKFISYKILIFLKLFSLLFSIHHLNQKSFEKKLHIYQFIGFFFKEYSNYVLRVVYILFMVKRLLYLSIVRVRETGCSKMNGK